MKIFKNPNIQIIGKTKRILEGFSLIEILITIAVAAVILPGVVALQSLSSFTSGQGETYTQAYTIAQEEMETIYNLKKTWDWESIPPYIPPTTLGFTKKVDIEPVDRCFGNDRIYDSSCGTAPSPDDFTKKIIVTVSWEERGKGQKIELISYVTRI